MVRIPRTCQSRAQLVYARLLLRVYPRRTMANAFEGPLLKPGSVVDENALWPNAQSPENPLLLEYAGNDKTGRGHRRSNDVYIIWRFDRARRAWDELVRSTSQGADWIAHLKPVAVAELARAGVKPDPVSAGDVTTRVLAVLDRELEPLDSAERHLVMSFVYQEFSARAAEFAA